MALRELIAEFGVKFDDRELKRGNQSVGDGISKMKAFIGVVASSALVVGLKNMVTGLASEADALAKQSRALGLNMQELQEWRHAANLSGVGAEAFGKSIIKMQRAASEAADGVATYVDAFKAAGVEVKDAATGSIKPTSQLLEELAVGFMNIKDPAQRTAAAMDIFGRQGSQLMNLFENGPEGIKKLRAELEQLGGGFTPEFAKNAEEMNDNISRLDMSSLSLKVTVGNFLLPVISKLAIGSARMIGRFTKWAKETGFVDKAMGVLKATVAWLGGVGLAKLIKLSGGFKRIALIVARFAATFLLPILALDDLIVFFQGGDSLIGRALDKMFGKGTQEKVRKWFTNATEAVKEFIRDFDLSDPVNGIGKLVSRLGKLGPLIAGVAATVASVWVASMAKAVAGGVVYLASLAKMIIAQGLLLATNPFAWIVVGVGLAVAAIAWLVENWDQVVADFEYALNDLGTWFGEMWDDVKTEAGEAWDWIIEKVKGAVGAIKDYVLSIPGVSLVLKGVDAIGSAVEGLTLGEGAEKPVASRPVSPRDGAAINAPTNINIAVPPGTPAAQARAVGNAAAAGASRGNRATLNAVKRLAPG